MSELPWVKINTPELRQGDYLQNCYVPLFGPDFGKDHPRVPVATANLIVITQSCDLEAEKVRMVALCPVHSLQTFEDANPDYRKKGMWEPVRKGRVDGLHLLPSQVNSSNNRDSLVVDFREIVSLPLPYLKKHAQEYGDRWRLNSPYLEHFSQAFARFFMRVGLPTSIPKFE
jgi:hypothetical protein